MLPVILTQVFPYPLTIHYHLPILLMLYRWRSAVKEHTDQSACSL